LSFDLPLRGSLDHCGSPWIDSVCYASAVAAGRWSSGQSLHVSEKLRMGLGRTAAQANAALVRTAEFANTNAFGGNKFHVDAPISAFADVNLPEAIPPRWSCLGLRSCRAAGSAARRPRQWRTGQNRFKELCHHGISKFNAGWRPARPRASGEFQDHPSVEQPLRNSYFDSLGLTRIYVPTQTDPSPSDFASAT
jgi:hypothetical protein